MQSFTSNAESAQMWGPMMATAAIAARQIRQIRQIRRRYTMLDLAAETGRLHAAFDVLFRPHGARGSASTPTLASSSRHALWRTTPD